MTGHTQPVLRPARAEDARSLAEVHLAAWQHTYRGILDQAWLDSLTAETFEGYHRPRLTPPTGPEPGSPFLVACPTEDGPILGFARCGPTRDKTPTGGPLPDGFHARFDAELYALYIQPSLIGAGVGLALFRAARSRLSALGHSTLCVWVLADNTLGRRFYERQGGIPVAECPLALGGRDYPQVAYAWPREQPTPH